MDVSRIKQSAGGNPLWPNGVGPSSNPGGAGQNGVAFARFMPPPGVTQTTLPPVPAQPGAPATPTPDARSRSEALEGYRFALQAVAPE